MAEILGQNEFLTVAMEPQDDFETRALTDHPFGT